ncbi:MAG TPA: chorismate mutase [Longimicrobium sp.]
MSAQELAPPDEDGWRGANLEAIRDEIERIDRAIIALIAERVRLAREVGVAKRARGLPILDPRARQPSSAARGPSPARPASRTTTCATSTGT